VRCWVHHCALLSSPLCAAEFASLFCGAIQTYCYYYYWSMLQKMYFIQNYYKSLDILEIVILRWLLPTASYSQQWLVGFVGRDVFHQLKNSVFKSESLHRSVPSMSKIYFKLASQVFMSWDCIWCSQSNGEKNVKPSSFMIDIALVYLCTYYLLHVRLNRIRPIASDLSFLTTLPCSV